MGFSSTQNGHHQKAAKECGDPIVLAIKYPSFNSSSSLSSSSSSLASSYFPDDSCLRPGTPFRFSGVPFSWEHLPGIPKNLHNHNKKEYSMKLLPLPPPTILRTSKNNSSEVALTRKKASAGASDSFRRVDPFFAALVECSKEDGDEATERNPWTEAKVTRSMSDRLGFINMYSSCKRSCAVSESTVYLPRSRRTADYGLINHRSSR
ncbi:Protease-associated RING/U-box zinc finger family protein [Hibiscus syriacus]|uniref:Protease-associated RING/U-box zinc finger family protein n=1 Tax=Hibiscus syriacus TaxID=106335 RepID=A0A6A3CII8_HIBSY|nr:uncharacterized protein LOC120192804 [Hibiscus syriacus]KAE8728527.1 Protease-associated RING/U-box zinc finger family protein [Hibiscus syriacus]